MVTDVAQLLAAVAHDKQEAYLTRCGNDPGILVWLNLAEDVFPAEIAAIRAVSLALDAYLSAQGFPPHVVERGVNAKLAVELWHLPAVAHKLLMGDEAADSDG